MPTGFENEWTQDELDNMYDFIMGNEGLTRPDENSGWVTDESGQAYTGYEAMSNEERRQAWDDWYNLADETGYDNLDNNDKLAYIQNGYRLGYLSADEAQALYEPVMDEMLRADGYVLQENGVYKKVTEDRQYGQDLEEYRTIGDYTSGDFGDGEWDGGINQEAPGVWSEYHENNATAGDYGREFTGGHFLKKNFGTLFAVGVSLITGGMAGPLAGAIASATGMGTAAATALANTIMNSAATLMQGGDLSLEDAIMAAAGGYIQGGGLEDLGDWLSSNSDLASGVVDKVNELGDWIEGGMDWAGGGAEILNDVISAGGMDVLKQLVTTGEIDLGEAIKAGVLNGASSQVIQFISDTFNDMFDGDAEAFENWLAEDDELSQAFIDADIRDPFLNPNYDYVADGLMVNNTTGEVFNHDGDSIGNMDDLDLDGNGVLDGNDLENIEVDAEKLPDYVPADSMDDANYVTTIAGNDYYALPGDNDTLYFEDGSVAAVREENGYWSIRDENGNEIMYQNDADLGFVQDSGPIDFQEQTNQQILQGSEAVMYDPQTGEYHSVGSGVDVPPAVMDEHGYYLVRGEDGIVYITDGITVEKYMGGNYAGDDPLVNDGLESHYNDQSYAWQHVHGGGELPSGAVIDEDTGEIVFPEEPIEQEPEDTTEETDTQETPNDNANTDTEVTEQGGGGATDSIGGSGGSGEAGDNDATVGDEGGFDAIIPGYNGSNDPFDPQDITDSETGGLESDTPSNDEQEVIVDEGTTPHEDYVNPMDKVTGFLGGITGGGSGIGGGSGSGEGGGSGGGGAGGGSGSGGGDANTGVGGPSGDLGDYAGNDNYTDHDSTGPGGGTDGGSGGGSGGGNGGGDGTGSGGGGGTGGGGGDGGSGDGSGQGGEAEVKWTDLFEYTTITKPDTSPYAPQLRALKQARGMMNDIFGSS